MANDAYREGYARIFGDKEAERGSYIFDPDIGKFVPRAEYNPDRESTGPTVLKQLDEFVSPIDGTRITDRGQLRRHNKKHGVTNINDYGDNGGRDYFMRKGAERDSTLRGNTQQAKQERVETIKRALHEAGRQ